MLWQPYWEFCMMLIEISMLQSNKTFYFLLLLVLFEALHSFDNKSDDVISQKTISTQYLQM